MLLFATRSLSLMLLPSSLRQSVMVRGAKLLGNARWRPPQPSQCGHHHHYTRRSFSFSATSSSHYAVSAQAHKIPQQVGEVITRLAPSQRVPGLRGVFLTKAVKKFRPIEVLPSAATAVTTAASSHMPSLDSAAGGASDAKTNADTTTLAARTTCDGSSSSGNSSSNTSNALTMAPPLVLNLAFAPRHHISLRRFLVLRHMFSSTDYLHAATEDGWYLIAPSTAAPLCDDVAGLERWTQLHHRRYLNHRHHQQHLHQNPAAASPPSLTNQHGGPREGATTSAKTTRALSPREARLAKHAELAKLEAALDSGEELTEAQLRALAEKERKAVAAREEVDEADQDEPAEDGEESEKDGEGGEYAKSADTAAAVLDRSLASVVVTGSTAALSSSLRTMPPLITEAHLFEINDGIYWKLPPSDDLANHDYWKGHRQRMELYQNTGDADAAEQRETLLNTIRSDPRAQACSEQELHAAAEALFQILKQKANVMLSVDGDSGLLTLIPLQDLNAGDELFLHYGREWWTGRLLSSLLLAVSDAEMRQVRWIEQLFGYEADKNELFPLLVPAYQQRRRKSAKHIPRLTQEPQRQQAMKEKEMKGTAAASAEEHRGHLVLYNAVTRAKATDAAVLAFAVRRSCVDEAFFCRLVQGNPARGVPPVFRLSTPDAEIPMRVLRRVLLASLRGVGEAAEETGEAATAASPSTTVESRTNDTPINERIRQVAPGNTSNDNDGDDGVFSV